MRAGLGKPIFRSGAGDAEMDQWSEAFEALIPAKAYQTYLADTAMTDATDQDRCAVSTAFYAAPASFPAEAAVRMFKTLNSDEEDETPSVAAVPMRSDPAAS